MGIDIMQNIILGCYYSLFNVYVSETG